MNCAVIEVEQGTPEWHMVRAPLLTASDAPAIFARPRKGYEEAATHEELRVKLALARLIHQPIEQDGYVSKWMERGTQLQQDGVNEYELETGQLVQSVGFLKHDTLPIGCSPDGVVGDWRGGVEVKAPKATTHFSYLKLNGKVPAEYLPQLMHSLYVSGLPFWDFVSFHPQFTGATRLYRVRLRREDVDLDAYALAVSLFLTEVEKTVEQLRALGAVEE